MSYFKAKMHQIQFRLNLRGLLLREGGRGGVEGKGKGVGRGGTPGSCLHPPDVKSWIKPWGSRRDTGNFFKEFITPLHEMTTV